MNTPLFFFTAEDPREIPKGSRDPLRFLPIWSKVARQMIPYLTTVTPSYRGFLTRFLFHAAIETISPRLANGSKNEQWDAFNKFEQFCAIIRSHTLPSTPDFPGKSNISGRNKNGQAEVGTSLNYWLMRSQQNTGFWGYYHQASLGSGLLRHNTHPAPGYLLSEEARMVAKNSFVDDFIAQHMPFLKALFEQKKIAFTIEEFADWAKFFAIKPTENGDIEWQAFWQEHLLTPRAQGTESYSSGTQHQFAKSVAKILEQSPTAGAPEIWEKLADTGNEAVMNHAHRVKSSEAVIGLCEWVFDACRLRSEGGENLKKANDWAIQQGYGEHWLSKLRQIDEPIEPELSKYRHIALSGNYTFEPLATELIRRHQSVMQQRKGSPWVELDESGGLHIRQPVAEPRTPELDDGSSGIKWRYDYFLGSWINVARELGYIRGPEGE